MGYCKYRKNHHQQRRHRKGLAEGLEKGLAEGKTEGKAEGLQETARRLKTMGMTNEFIAQATGLSPEEINKL